MNENRIMGIDFGEVKIGIAISDPLKIIAEHLVLIFFLFILQLPQ